MRIKIAILLSVFILFECIYLLIGDGSVAWWNIAYFFNQSILIIGILSIVRGYFDTLLIDIAIGINAGKLIYNIILAIDPNLAAKINICFWVGLLFVLIIISVLINKWLQHDRGGS